MIKANDIRNAMRKRFCAPEWAIMWEVSNSTGAYGGKRYADAVMMSLWPSRGLELHGVEIKVSRADWKREAADPSKAETIAKYCDRWWVHTSPGVIDDVSDVPPAWGLREFDGKRWKTVREADKVEAIPTDRGFLAALLRRASEGSEALIANAIEKAIADEKASIADRVQQEVTRRTRKYDKLVSQIAEFEEAFGCKITSKWGNGASLDYQAVPVGKTAAALVKAGFRDSEYEGLRQIRTSLARSLSELDDAIAAGPSFEAAE